MLERRSRKSHLLAAALVIVVLWAGSLAAFAELSGFVGQGLAFNVVHWEVTRLATFAVNRASGRDRGKLADNATVIRYFDLLRQARGLEGGAERTSDPNVRRQDDAAAQKLRVEAGTLRVPVEARFEQAVSNAARKAGLTEHLPLYQAKRFVWPPVATSFANPPHILIISPHQRIGLQSTTLLRSDLSVEQQIQIEQDTERKRHVSALLDQIGGFGAYPSLVDENVTPVQLMQTVAHEWTHGYLAFHPLGARYAQSNDMTFINETVADTVGQELGSRAFDSLGLPQGVVAPPVQSTGSRIDFNRIMHNLRLEVDQLLKQGQVDAAEQRMNETQRLLAANGYNIRRINQAYFAFYGSYGDNPAASNPLGAKVASLRQLSSNLAAFVHRIQNVARPADLDRLLRTAQAVP